MAQRLPGATHLFGPPNSPRFHRRLTTRGYQFRSPLSIYHDNITHGANLDMFTDLPVTCPPRVLGDVTEAGEKRLSPQWGTTLLVTMSHLVTCSPWVLDDVTEANEKRLSPQRGTTLLVPYHTRLRVHPVFFVIHTGISIKRLKFKRGT